MAKKAKKIKTNKGLKLEIVNPNAAGIDVSSTEMQVCVPEDRDGDNNGSLKRKENSKKYKHNLKGALERESYIEDTTLFDSL